MGKFPIQIVNLSNEIDILSRDMDTMDVSSSIGDARTSVFGGRGLDFKGYREYSLEDDSKNIDWKASLRSDKLLVKEFLQERGLDVIFVYDVSDSMLFGSQSKIKAHYGAEFVLSLAQVAINSSYNVGLLCFNNSVKEMIIPGAGQDQMHNFFNILSEHSTYGGEFDSFKLLDFVMANYNDGSVIIFVSDFLGYTNKLDLIKNKMNIMSKKFDFICVVLRDPRDEFMPDLNMDVVVSSPNGKKSVLFNVAKIKNKYEEYNRKKKSELRSFFKTVGCDFLEIYTDKPFLSPTIEFFLRRGQSLK
nr:hypothetical protein [Nanoarchaeum sp.]